MPETPEPSWIDRPHVLVDDGSRSYDSRHLWCVCGRIDISSLHDDEGETER